MKLIPGLSWFAALRSRRQPRVVAPDHGDMGTAFGLDAIQSMFHEPAVEPGVEIDPNAPLPWEHRVTRRSGL